MNEIKIIGDISQKIAEPQQAGKKQGVSFEDTIKDALKEVNQIQNDAERRSRTLRKAMSRISRLSS